MESNRFTETAGHGPVDRLQAVHSATNSPVTKRGSLLRLILGVLLLIGSARVHLALLPASVINRVIAVCSAKFVRKHSLRYVSSSKRSLEIPSDPTLSCRTGLPELPWSGRFTLALSANAFESDI